VSSEGDLLYKSCNVGIGQGLMASSQKRVGLA